MDLAFEGAVWQEAEFWLDLDFEGETWLVAEFWLEPGYVSDNSSDIMNLKIDKYKTVGNMK